MWSIAETRRQNYFYAGQGQSDYSNENHRNDHLILSFTKYSDFSRGLKKQSPWGNSQGTFPGTALRTLNTL